MAQIYLPERTDEKRPPTRSPIPKVAEAETTESIRHKNNAVAQRIGWPDIVVIVALVGISALLIAAAGRAQSHTRSVDISLSPASLPLYAVYSLLRMVFAYVLSLVFTLVYGHIAATNKRAERFMVPILDILQSIPILSFLPTVVLTLVAFFPNSSIGVELAAIILIFTSQAWNMTFSFYHSAKTLPLDLREASVVYHLSPWRRFARLEVPFAMIGLVYNSMMSFAGGWFFLMAAEQLVLGRNSYQLPGLGSYLQVAANNGDTRALFLGLGTLIVLIILLDALFWRPLVAWADKFKFEQTRSADVPESPILDIIRRSALLETFTERIVHPTSDRFNALLARLMPETTPALQLIDEHAVIARKVTVSTVLGWLITSLFAVAAFVGVISGVRLVAHVSLGTWLGIIGAGGVTLLRTMLAITIALAWTVPVGVAIGMNPKWSRRMQPVVQVVASIPATAFFPVLLPFVLAFPAGINFAAIGLMLLGTQWYVLFNVIAGAMAIPADLRESAQVYRVTGWRRWKTLILPAIFPYLVTGMITASGGAWNASIIAEFITFHNKPFSTVGLGATIAKAAADNSLPVLLAATITMAVIVVAINRLVWHRLYQLAERRYNLG